jgi:uncharacterized protein involved in propanediol utilization
MTQNAPEITPARARAFRKVRARVAGHFGELVQGRLGPEGPVALVTLRRERLVTEVIYTPAPGPLVIETVPNDLIRRAATTMLNRYGEPGMGGTLQVRRPAAPGHGMGSSTADLLGTIRALSQAFNQPLSADEEAVLCLEIEGAIDPLMFDTPCVFASREARILEHLVPMPVMRVVGVCAGGGRQTDPADLNFPDVAPLFADLKHALAARDILAIGQIATRSAELNQTRNPNPAWQQMRELAQACGAAGLVVAHTGSAIGMILPAEMNLKLAITGARSLGYGQVHSL